MTITKSAIKEVIETMCLDFDQPLIDIYNTLLDEYLDSRGVENVDDFYLSIIGPFQHFLRILINKEIGENRHLVFILTHSNFLKNHLDKLFEKHEGESCRADKTRSVLNSLITFFKDEHNKEIEWGYEQEYTYHLPEKILTSHSEIMDFYMALYALYYGSPDKYVSALMTLEKQKI